MNRQFATIPTLWNPMTFQALMEHCIGDGVEIHEALDNIVSVHLSSKSVTVGEISEISSASIQTDDSGEQWPIQSIGLDRIDFTTIETKPAQAELDRLVRAQAPRNFVPKVALRTLASLSQEGQAPSLEVFQQESLRVGRIFREHYRSHEVMPELQGIYDFNQKLSSGFPKNERDMARIAEPEAKRNAAMKSEDRFLSVYIAQVRKSDGFGIGVLHELGFIHIEAESPHRVHLSDDGLMFASLTNPVLDENANSGLSLSDEEVDFIIHHYRDNSPTEWEFLSELAGIIQYGAGMSVIRPHMMAVYRDKWEDRNGSRLSENRLQSRVESIAGSALNRLEEAGLISKSRVSASPQRDKSAPPQYSPPSMPGRGSFDRVKYLLNQRGVELLIGKEVV